MRMRQRLVTGLAVWSVVFGAVSTRADVRQDAVPTVTPSTDGLPEGAGRDSVARVCGLCHEAKRAASLRLTREGWDFIVHEMMKRGARPASDDETAAIIDYLSTQFLGEAPRPVNLNTAPQIDLETVLGLLRREAAAVVAYREANGPFKALDDLKKVQGLDFTKIEAGRDRVVVY